MREEEICGCVSDWESVVINSYRILKIKGYEQHDDLEEVFCVCVCVMYYVIWQIRNITSEVSKKSK